MVKFYNQYFRDNQPLLFIFVGALNTLFGYTIFTFFVLIGLHYALAALLANSIGVLFNFKTTGKIVFKNSDNALLIKFFMVYVVVYIVNVITIGSLKEITENIYVSGAISTMICALIAYFLNKNYVFKKDVA